MYISPMRAMLQGAWDVLIDIAPHTSRFTVRTPLSNSEQHQLLPDLRREHTLLPELRGKGQNEAKILVLRCQGMRRTCIPQAARGCRLSETHT